MNTKHRPRYSLILFITALFLWAYSFSWAVTKNFWKFVLFDFLYLTPATAQYVFGILFIILAISAWSAILIHVSVIFYRPLRLRYSPNWLSHIAILAIAWLAVGSSMVISTREFPFIQKTAEQDAVAKSTEYSFKASLNLRFEIRAHFIYLFFIADQVIKPDQNSLAT